MITAGIDIGSTTTKVAILEDKRIIASAVIPSENLPKDSADKVLLKCNFEKNRIEKIVTTGYGRRLSGTGDLVITEIKACALGIQFDLPLKKIRTIIDVGGQDTKVILLNVQGDVEDFSMNDKCAAGTGRFLEMLAFKLSMSYEEFTRCALSFKTPIQMNSTCAVFAESEVVSMLARGVDVADIAGAAHSSIADRIGSVVRRMGLTEPVCFTGGGALNRALVRSLESNLGINIIIPEKPQIIAAIGAAVAGIS